MFKVIFIFLIGGTAKIAFLHHGNQHFSDNGNYALRPGDYGYNGNSYHRILDTHEYYNCPVDIHISGTLTQSFTFLQNDRGLIQRLKNSSFVYITGGTYAEHIMPYVDSVINRFSLRYAKTVYSEVLNGNGWIDYPDVLWIPERVFKSESMMPYSLVKILNEEYGKFDSQGRYLAPCIVLDDNVHSWYAHSYPDGTPCNNSRKVHIMYDTQGNYVYVVFIQRTARDQMVWNDISNPSNPLHQMLASLSNDPDQEQIVLYGDDWEKAAGVAGWDFGHPGVPATSYDSNIRFIKNQNWVQPVHIAEVVKWWGVDKLFDADPLNDPPTINIHYATYQELHDWTGGSYDNWYNNFKNSQAWGCAGGPDLNGNGISGDYEDVWKFACEQLMAAPDNEISKLGWITLSSMLYETAWHTGPGGELVYWGKNLWNHTRYGGIFAFGAQWLNTLRFQDHASIDSADLDADGVLEYALYNDKICLVFDKRGGRALSVFTADGECVVGNLMTNWNGEGDFYEGAHPGAFNETQGENSLFSVQTGYLGDTAVITFQEQYNWRGSAESDILKTLTLVPGKAYVKLSYNSNYTNWTKVAVTPSISKQLQIGYNLQPLYGISQNGWSYAGYESLYDSTKAVFVYPSGQGLIFNFLGRMASGAELIELGGRSGSYSFYFYAGKGDPEIDVPGPGDLEGPRIWNTTFSPNENILQTDSVLVTSTIMDPSGIQGAWVRYTHNNWQSYSDLQMFPDDGNLRDYNNNGVADPNLYGVFIPPYPTGTRVFFAICARDGSTAHNESWDNNNGNNYSYTVGFQDFIMDGELDRIAWLFAENPGMHLYGYYDENLRKLYLATEAAGNATSGQSGNFFNDHFIFLSFNPSTMVAAPWAKSGQVGRFHLFLADEDNNNFAGWFDSTGNLISDSVHFHCASSISDLGYLEGVVDLSIFENHYSLDSIFIAVGSYATQDGGSLQWQVPRPTNPNGHIELSEFFILHLNSTEVVDSFNTPRVVLNTIVMENELKILLLGSENPEIFLSIYDVSGRRVRFAKVSAQKKESTVSVSLNNIKGGVYFLECKFDAKVILKKFVKVR